MCKIPSSTEVEEKTLFVFHLLLPIHPQNVLSSILSLVLSHRFSYKNISFTAKILKTLLVPRFALNIRKFSITLVNRFAIVLQTFRFVFEKILPNFHLQLQKR